MISYCRAMLVMVILPFVVAGCTMATGKLHAGSGKIELTNVLACRLANYGKYEEAAYTHLPAIGVK